MEDKKLRGKIADIWLDYDEKVKQFMVSVKGCCLVEHPSITEALDKTMSAIIQARKVGESPVLTDEEIIATWNGIDYAGWEATGFADDFRKSDHHKVDEYDRAIAKAQRDADKKSNRQRI